MGNLYVYDRECDILCATKDIDAYADHPRYPILRILKNKVQQYGSGWMLDHVTVKWDHILENVGSGYFMMMDIENATRFKPDRLDISTNALLFMVRELHRNGVTDVGYKYGDEIIFNSDNISILRDTPDQPDFGIRYHRSAVHNPQKYDTKRLLEHNAFAKTYSKKFHCMMVY